MRLPDVSIWKDWRTQKPKTYNNGFYVLLSIIHNQNFISKFSGVCAFMFVLKCCHKTLAVVKKVTGEKEIFFRHYAWIILAFCLKKPYLPTFPA